MSSPPSSPPILLPTFFFSWYRTGYKHYPILNSFIIGKYQQASLQRILRVPQNLWLSSQEDSPSWPALFYSLIGCERSATEVWGDIMVSDIKSTPTALNCICQGPSHDGPYMDEGTSYNRIGLLPHIVPGDCLASASYSMPHLLFACACPMSDDTGLY